LYNAYQLLLELIDKRWSKYVYRVFGSVVVVLRFAELLLEGVGQLIEQSHLLAVLQETGGSRGLV